MQHNFEEGGVGRVGTDVSSATAVSSAGWADEFPLTPAGTVAQLMAGAAPSGVGPPSLEDLTKFAAELRASGAPGAVVVACIEKYLALFDQSADDSTVSQSVGSSEGSRSSRRRRARREAVGLFVRSRAALATSSGSTYYHLMRPGKGKVADLVKLGEKLGPSPSLYRLAYEFSEFDPAVKSGRGPKLVLTSRGWVIDTSGTDVEGGLTVAQVMACMPGLPSGRVKPWRDVAPGAMGVPVNITQRFVGAVDVPSARAAGIEGMCYLALFPVAERVAMATKYGYQPTIGRLNEDVGLMQFGGFMLEVGPSGAAAHLAFVDEAPLGASMLTRELFDELVVGNPGLRLGWLEEKPVGPSARSAGGYGTFSASSSASSAESTPALLGVAEGGRVGQAPQSSPFQGRSLGTVLSGSWDPLVEEGEVPEVVTVVKIGPLGYRGQSGPDLVDQVPLVGVADHVGATEMPFPDGPPDEEVLPSVWQWASELEVDERHDHDLCEVGLGYATSVARGVYVAGLTFSRPDGRAEAGHWAAFPACCAHGTQFSYVTSFSDEIFRSVTAGATSLPLGEAVVLSPHVILHVELVVPSALVRVPVVLVAQGFGELLTRAVARVGGPLVDEYSTWHDSDAFADALIFINSGR